MWCMNVEMMERGRSGGTVESKSRERDMREEWQDYREQDRER